ncbi:MAG: 2-oxoacid:acceptor oxidoreductase subunit alpha [Gemmatimonadota bacterium]|nr:2-oxoacid:acceptor oxidoreductase subunit alpha [Gemmatimonadota bacterium]
MRLIQGNEACALGALHAGCNFYAGYPITPATEIMEHMARLLPPRRGVFVQMEDEIAALAAVIGAAWAGSKAMTATSGPGFSLMQENLGYAAMTDTPCVVVDSQRMGPSTGLPTLPSQGDVMQARWGSHGDRPGVTLTASSVRNVYEVTVAAFNISEQFRVPVVLLLDAVVSHMREGVEFPDLPVVTRKRPVELAGFLPFGGAEFMPLGAGKPIVVTGLAHAESGLPRATDGANAERMLHHAIDRIDAGSDVILRTRPFQLEDAEVGIIAYGISARPARGAVALLRAEGIRAGLLELETLWPLPERAILALAARTRLLLVPELNLGQLVLAIRATVEGRTPVVALNRVDGLIFPPEQMAGTIRQALGRMPVALENPIDPALVEV